MYPLVAILAYMTKIIDTNFAGRAASGASFRLIADPGSDLDDRLFDWGGDIENYECDFHGYNYLAADNGGTDSAWKSLAYDGLKVASQQIEVSWTRNDAVPHSHTRTTATHIVYLGTSTDGSLIVKIWQLPAPFAFDSDGKQGKWKVRMFGLNDIDVA